MQEPKCNDPETIKLFKEQWLTFGNTYDNCARNCWAFSGCTNRCLVEKTKISSQCASCFVDLVGCITYNCLLLCNTKPYSEECSKCKEKANCYTNLERCTGLCMDQIPIER